MAKRKGTSKTSTAIEKAMRARPITDLALGPKDYLSSGCTTLNLACTGKTKVAFGKGHYVLWIGDSSSGKTMFAMGVLAEACRNPEFDDYALYFDPSENGMLMDVKKFFGEKTAARIQLPPWGVSKSIEEMYYSLRKLNKLGKPFIFVEDSVDALTSTEETKKIDEQMAAHDAGTQTAGTMIDGKAKKHSSMLRGVVNDLGKAGSILILLGQTRDNITPGAWEKKTRAGGRALRFYSHHELWSSTTEKIKKTVRGKPRIIGIRTRIIVKKNRLQGYEGPVDNVLIYRSYGIDDVGSCIDYLIDENEWKTGGGEDSKKGKVIAPEFKFEGTRDALIKKIEEEGLEQRLRMITLKVWREIEEACKLKRKPKYV